MAANMGENIGYGNQRLNWLVERIERLKMLWERGWSASRIGDDLGISRNAVIGKLHRLNGYKPAVHYAPRKIAKPPPIKKRPARPPEPEPEPEPIDVVSLDFTLDELKAGVCHYPHGTAAPYLFCGQPTAAGSPYCALHRRMTLQRYQPGAAPDWRPLA